MWSLILLLFLLVHLNDGLVRFKRGTYGAVILCGGIGGYVAFFSMVHGDTEFQNSQHECPPSFDLSIWVRMSLICGVGTIPYCHF